MAYMVGEDHVMQGYADVVVRDALVFRFPAGNIAGQRIRHFRGTPCGKKQDEVPFASRNAP